MENRQFKNNQISLFDSYRVEKIGWTTKSIWARHSLLLRLQDIKVRNKMELPPDFENRSQWNEALQKMIDSFAFLDDIGSLPPSTEALDDPALVEGVVLFFKYYNFFWFSESYYDTKLHTDLVALLTRLIH